jgi:hypothetical protein
MKQYLTFVKPSYENFVEPSKRWEAHSCLVEYYYFVNPRNTVIDFVDSSKRRESELFVCAHWKIQPMYSDVMYDNKRCNPCKIHHDHPWQKVTFKNDMEKDIQNPNPGIPMWSFLTRGMTSWRRILRSIWSCSTSNISSKRGMQLGGWPEGWSTELEKEMLPGV